jgi:hypothetical protein
MMHDAAAAHVTTERFVFGAMTIALDQLPAGPAVVVVVARVVGVVFMVGALDEPGVWLHPAATKRSAKAAAITPPRRLDCLVTMTVPAGRSPRGRDGVTTYRARSVSWCR